MFCIVAIALLGAAVAEAQIYSPYLHHLSLYDARSIYHPYAIAPRFILPAADIAPKIVVPVVTTGAVIPKPVEDTEEVKRAKMEFAEAYKRALLVKDEEVKEEIKEEVKEDRKKRDLATVMAIPTMTIMPMMTMRMPMPYMTHYPY